MDNHSLRKETDTFRTYNGVEFITERRREIVQVMITPSAFEGISFEAFLIHYLFHLIDRYFLQNFSRFMMSNSGHFFFFLIHFELISIVRDLQQMLKLLNS